MLLKQRTLPTPALKLVGKKKEAPSKMKRRVNRDKGITETGLQEAKIGRQCNGSATLQVECTPEPSGASRDYQNHQDKEPYTKVSATTSHRQKVVQLHQNIPLADKGAPTKQRRTVEGTRPKRMDPPFPPDGVHS